MKTESQRLTFSLFLKIKYKIKNRSPTAKKVMRRGTIKTFGSNWFISAA